MKLTGVLVVAGAMIAGTTLAYAQGGANITPGMQDKGPKNGSPGASGYAPGHETQEKGAVKSTEGASGYAPGQSENSDSPNNENAKINR